MIIPSRMKAWTTSAFALATLCGCNALSTSSLSPPHVRSASAFTQETATEAVGALSCEYQNWLDEVKHFWHQTKREFHLEYQANQAWPAPYNKLSRRSLREPLDVQAHNGRVEMASMWDYHFKPDSGELTVMGRQRVQDVIDQAGVVGRTIYVRRAEDPDKTKARLAAVQAQLGKLGQDQLSFDVVESNANPSIVSGIEAMNALDRLTTPTDLSGSATTTSMTTGGRQGTP